MAFHGRRPLPEDHYLNRGTAIVFQFRGPQRSIEPLPGCPSEDQLEEEGRHAEALRRLKIHRMIAELRDRVRIEQELGHKIAPRVLDSRWDLPLPGSTPVPTADPAANDTAAQQVRVEAREGLTTPVEPGPDQAGLQPPQ